MQKIAYQRTRLDYETNNLYIWTLLDDGSSISRKMVLSTEDGSVDQIWSKVYGVDELPSEWLREMSKMSEAQ